MLCHVSLRMRSAALLVAVVVLILLTHTAHTAWADTKTCTAGSQLGLVSTGCFTPSQQANTLAVLRAFTAAIPALKSVWVGDDFCAWSRYMRCFSDGAYISLESANEGDLVGTLPEIPASVNASEVMVMDVHLVNLHAEVTGTLPSSWGRMSRLVSVWLVAPGLTGTLPDWTTLTALQSIYIRMTAMTGTLPDAWSSLTSLTGILVTYTDVAGTLPASWSALTELRTVWLFSNQLTGTLPASWSSLTHLSDLKVYNNDFCGCVPASWMASATALRKNWIVDAKNTAAGGCATLTCTPTTTTTKAPTTTTTTTTTTTKAPAASCLVANCKACKSGDATRCQTCAPGLIASSEGFCMTPGMCFVAACSRCVSTSAFACQTCFPGYTLTASKACA